MEALASAINNAYQAHITSLYKALSQALLLAGDNEEEIASAKLRFRNGLAFAERVKQEAYSAAGI